MPDAHPESPPIPLLDEPAARAFLQANPDVQQIDLYLADLNGLFRGKRVDTDAFLKAVQSGTGLPASVFASDITGATVPNTGYGLVIGDADFPVYVARDGLSRQPWGQTGRAQAQLLMTDEHGSALPIDPIKVLDQVLDRARAQGWRPVVAVELEFYLLKPGAAQSGPVIAPSPITGRTPNAVQVYSLAELEVYEAFLKQLMVACEVQGLPADGASSEYAPGQLEVNLQHHADAQLACHQALQLKRLVKAVAAEQGMEATFMPRPFLDEAGSGMHIHVSLIDEQGANVFDDEAKLTAAVAGALGYAGDFTLLAAPHANSYRRLRREGFAPVSKTWGYNNRTVAVRIPTGQPRIEYRVAGADANPYLLVAATVAALLDGIQSRMTPPEPVSGNAYDEDAPLLPLSWEKSLDTFTRSRWCKAALGEDFCRFYEIVKSAELREFQRTITPLEYEWYLAC